MNTTPCDTSRAAAPGTTERLYARQAELLERLAAAQRATLELAHSPQGRSVTDFKEEAEQAERDLLGDAQAERDHAELVEVRSAIARLQDCSYGMCIACGEPIDLQRLQVRPQAMRCTACQAANEALALKAHPEG